ncbi:hypothetical protein [Parabacteroides chongii]|uniref:hypothetical protein n=1 Tax=Parabacteroides chongii TaxID=2685834 RepID=UPI00240E25C4|nr:hypothetical protein [Parabacteroides chongii]WFE86603.1 hypothetical protein P3L47_08440 [Parabacteroides chongii]
MRKIFISRITLLLATFLIACASPDKQCLEQALTFAGENREELEKVLSHYTDDSLKLAAARFLIMNMPGHAGYSPAIIPILQPVYDKHMAISEKYNWKRPDGWRSEIKNLWNEESLKINFNKYPDKPDIQTIKADWLIKEIDLAFKAWKENAYSKDAPFEVFCKHILPYRFSDKFCPDNNREIFYNRHHGIFSHAGKDFRVITDSLHFTYDSIMNSVGYAASMPICNIASYERIKRATCDIQTQFNAHMMSALGMPVTIDFVPMWGNPGLSGNRSIRIPVKSGGHSSSFQVWQNKCKRSFLWYTIYLLQILQKQAKKANRSLNNFVESTLMDAMYTEPNVEAIAAIKEARTARIKKRLTA